jgi:hypothetical protein
MDKCLLGRYEFVPEGICTITYCGYECQDCHFRDMCLGTDYNANLLCRNLWKDGTPGYNQDGGIGAYKSDPDHE